MAAELPEADRVALCVAIGCAEILESVATRDQRDDPVLVLVVLLVLLVLITCLLLAIIVDLEKAAAALSPAAVLGWLGNLASIKLALAVAFLVFGFVLYMTANVMLATRKS